MKRIVAILLLATPALAQDINSLKPGSFTIDRQPEMIGVSLGAEGCIRGPFDVYGKDGKTIFHIDAGLWFPTGCEKDKKK